MAPPRLARGSRSVTRIYEAPAGTRTCQNRQWHPSQEEQADTRSGQTLTIWRRDARAEMA